MKWHLILIAGGRLDLSLRIRSDSSPSEFFKFCEPLKAPLENSFDISGTKRILKFWLNFMQLDTELL